MSTELGNLLKTMIDILKARRGQTMAATLAYLEERLDYSTHAIRKWMQGKHRPDPDTLARLVEIGVAETGMDRHWAERVLYQGEHPNRNALLRRLFPSPAAPAVHHNLPRRPYIRLVGREDEVAEIMHRLAPEQRHWLIPIEGVGGVGKSTLAMEVGWLFVEGYEQLPSGRRFDALVWASAKREALTTQGVETIPQPRQTLTNLDDIYRALADVLDWPAILRVPREDQPREVEKALRKAGRVLVILDNLETVDDPQVLAFLRELPPPAKAIATMRFHEDMPYPIRLQELSPVAARELVVQECAGRRITLADSEINQLLETARGLPLAIWWVVGLMGMEGYSVETTLHRLRDPQGELLQFIFAQAVSTLRTDHLDAYYTLLALTFFDLDDGASLPALAATVGLNEETTRVALHRLLNMNLVNRMESGDRFTMLPLTHSFAQTDVETVTAWEQEARGRWLAWYGNFVAQSVPADLPMDRWSPVERVSPLLAPDVKLSVERELGCLLRVLQWCLDTGNSGRLSKLYRDLAAFLFAEGIWESALYYGKRVVAYATQANNSELFVWCINVLVRVYSQRGNFDQAEEWLERAYGVITSIEREDRKFLLAVVMYAEGGLLSKKENYTEAEQKFSKALEIGRQANDLLMEAKCLNRLGNMCLRQERFRKASQYYEKSLNIRRKLDQSSLDVIDGMAVAKGNLGLVASRTGRYEEARDILLGLENQFVWQTDLAELYIELAIVAYYLGNLEQARQWAQQAEAIMTRLDLIRPYCGGDKKWLELKAAGKV